MSAARAPPPSLDVQESDELLAVVWTEVMGQRPPDEAAAMVERLEAHGLPALEEEQSYTLADLRFLKDCGNAEFKAQNFAAAIREYTKVLAAFKNMWDARVADTLRPVAMLRATVLSNRAQAYLNLALHKEASEDCTSALSMTMLHDEPALKSKVLHRLKLSAAPPTAAAKLAGEAAAAAAAATPRATFKVEACDCLGLLRTEERSVAEYALQLTNGDVASAHSLLSICRNPAHGDDVFSAVRHVLNERLERPITAVEIQALLKRLGEDTRVARCARAKRQRHNSTVGHLQALAAYCTTTLYPLLVEASGGGGAVAATLAPPLGFLSEFAPSQALPFFLHAADQVLGVPPGDAVCARTRARPEPDAEPDPSLRVMVEQTWLCYFRACNGSLDVDGSRPAAEEPPAEVLTAATVARLVACSGAAVGADEGEAAETAETDGEARDPWRDVRFCRLVHLDRLDKQMGPDDMEALHLRGDVKAGSPSPTPPPPPPPPCAAVPRLADLANVQAVRAAEMAAVSRGLHALEAARGPATGEGGPSPARCFNPLQWVTQLEMTRQRARLAAALPEVDDVWHLSYLQSTGGGVAGLPMLVRMGLSSQTLKMIEQSQPACVVLHARPLQPPPRPAANYRALSFADAPRPRLPQPVIATAHCTEPHDHGGGLSLADAIKRVLLLGAEARGGRCRKLILGPHSGEPGCSAFFIDYASPGGGGRTDLVQFIEEVLGIQDHRIDGWMERGRHPNWRMEFRSVTAAEFQAARAAGTSVWDM